MPRALMASRGERPFLSAWMEMPSMPIIARRPCLSSAVWSLKRASGDAEVAKPRGSK